MNLRHYFHLLYIFQFSHFNQVIDEAMHVLTLVMESKEAPRTHDLLQELRDISSMAMEHFDEKIAPGLKRKLGEGQTVNVNTIGAACEYLKSGHDLRGWIMSLLQDIMAYFILCRLQVGHLTQNSNQRDSGLCLLLSLNFLQSSLLLLEK